MSDSDTKTGGLRVIAGGGKGGAVGEPQREILKEIDELVQANRVVLFMKGTPARPMCGFSARAAAILSVYGVPFRAVDVLQDNEIREGIKEYADWPTIPQLFVGGQFIGGSDIMTSLHESGELKGMLVE